MAFAKPICEAEFNDLQLLSLQIDSRIVNLVAQGDETEIQAFLKKKQPLMMEMLPVSLEEMFVFQMLKKAEVKE